MIKKIYSRLPVLLQNLACNYYGYKESKLRFDRNFEEKLQELISNDYSLRNEINDYQKVQLSQLLTFCKCYNPFYSKLIQKHNILPKNTGEVKNFEQFPVLTKRIINTNRDKLLSIGYDKDDLEKKSTSGTTGSSLSFWSTKESISFQWAVWWRHRSRFGIKPGDWHVNFTGRPVVPLKQKKPPFWRWDFFRKQLIVNMQSLKRENIHEIAAVIDNSRFKFFAGAPSMIYAFALLLEEEKIEILNKPQVIFPGAENVLDYQRDFFKKKFNCTISDQYGFTEACGNASKCEYGYYHEDWEYGLLECEERHYNPDGTYTGNILATGFSNYAFPFIKYRVGDIGTWMPDDFHCPCGRHSKALKQIDGRIEDFIITPEGNKVMRFSYLFKETAGINEAQIIQSELGSILIKYVPNRNFSYRDKEIVLDKVKNWISTTLNVHFEEVKELEKSKSGKVRGVISRLN